MVFFATALPMALAVAVLVLGVREPAVQRPKKVARGPLPRGYAAFLAVAALFSLGNVSYVFLLLRARDLGASEVTAVGLYVLANVVYAAVSVPVGELSDRVGRAPLLGVAFVASAVASAGFALAPSWEWTIPLFVVYGAFLAAFETVSRAFAVDLAPAASRGTALGMYHATVGLAALPAALLAGALWDGLGPAAPFAAGAAFALLAALLLPAAARRVRAAPTQGTETA
jgi:MFS family permease